jgi:hypothetical protein
MKHITIGVTDDTTPDEMDRYFTQIWHHEEKCMIAFDVTQCDNVSLRRALRLKPVLNKHRENSKKFLQRCQILVKSKFAKTILRIALYLLKPDMPVMIVRVKPN